MNQFMCACGASYPYKQGLSRHGKTCQKFQLRRANNKSGNLTAEERESLNTDLNVDQKSVTIINNDYSKNDNSTTNNNDNSTTNNITNNNYNMKVDYLNPISYYDLSHLDPTKIWEKYKKGCKENGIGCILEDVFENDYNKNIKAKNDKFYSSFCCNMDTEKDTPPKFRDILKLDQYGVLVDRLSNRILMSEMLKDKSEESQRWTRYILDEEISHINNYNNYHRRNEAIKVLDKIANRLSKLKIEKKNKYLHEEGFYDTDSLSD